MDTDSPLIRPRPDVDLISMDGLTRPDLFVPAPDLLEWLRAAYLDDAGPLWNEEHSHLADASIGCMWTNCENRLHQRVILGQAEMPSRTYARWGTWAKQRAFQQLREWFGEVPDFIITLDAVFCDQADDATFAALVDHELYHCGQEIDGFGMPRFNQRTGEPMYCIRGHDVEEFVGVVRRFGIEAAGQQAVDMVIAAAAAPKIGRAKLTDACGTCVQLLRKAA